MPGKGFPWRWLGPRRGKPNSFRVVGWFISCAPPAFAGGLCGLRSQFTTAPRAHPQMRNAATLLSLVQLSMAVASIPTGPIVTVGLMLFLAAPAVGNPNRMNDNELAQCAQNNCPTMGGHGAPQAGNALTVTGKTDGGTYTPGETLNLAITGNGQYTVAGYADGQVLGRTDGTQSTVTAPQAGEIVLIGLVSGGQGQAVT